MRLSWLPSVGSHGCSCHAQIRDGKRRWAWAVAFLRYAGIVAINSRQWRNGLEFIVTDLSDAISLLESAGTELMDSKEGYKRLSALLKSS
jgi:hypothetical protein